MKHLEAEKAWALVGNPNEETAQWRSHAENCFACRQILSEAEGAQLLLKALPPAPSHLPDALSRHVKQRLLADFESDVEVKGLFPWWRAWFFPIAAVAAVALVAFGSFLFSKKPMPSAPPDIANVAVVPSVQDPVVPEVPKSLVAQVRTQKKSNLATSKKSAKSLRTLAAGDVISTQKGGNVAFEMPDGTKAQVSATSDVTVAQLDEKHFGFEVKFGTLAMQVPHRDDRLLTVKVGEVLVKDLGTRFVVSRSAESVLVAVEEGSVEVQTPLGNRVLQAGRAVRVRPERIEELAWAPTPLARLVTPRYAPSKLREDDDGGENNEAVMQPIANSPDDKTDDDEDPASNPKTSPDQVDENWALPQTLPSQVLPSVPQPPARVMTATPKKKKWFALEALEERLSEIGKGLSEDIFGRQDARSKSAKQVTVMADSGDCNAAIIAADKWIVASKRVDEVPLTRSVLLQKVRCLNHLGRFEEAQRITIP
jgi:FecR protein